MHARAFAVIFFALSLPAVGQQGQTPAASQSPPASTSPAGSDVKTADAPAPDLTPDANGKLSQEQMRHLFRVVADKDIENQKRVHDYAYVEREVEHKLDGKGETKSTEVRTFEILEIYGEQVRRLIEKDDKPLDSKEAAKEEEKVQKIIDKRKENPKATVRSAKKKKKKTAKTIGSTSAK